MQLRLQGPLDYILYPFFFHLSWLILSILLFSQSETQTQDVWFQQIYCSNLRHNKEMYTGKKSARYTRANILKPIISTSHLCFAWLTSLTNETSEFFQSEGLSCT